MWLPIFLCQKLFSETAKSGKMNPASKPPQATWEQYLSPPREWATNSAKNKKISKFKLAWHFNASSTISSPVATLRNNTFNNGRSRWPRGLRRGSAAARLLGLRVRIQPGAWMYLVNILYCARRGLCDRRILCPGEPYQVCVYVCVCVCE